MPIQTDFSQWRYADGCLTITMTPPTAIGAWAVEVAFCKRFGGDAEFTRYLASGYSALSGVTVLDSGQGVFQAKIHGADTSGLDPGNYAFRARRTDSGSVTVIAEGYMVLRV